MGSEPRARALDGLRGLAALSVVAFHVWLYRPERVPGTRTSLGDQVFFELHLGLICFFVLSGFLLYRGLLRRPNLKRYAVHRIARIVPAYYVSIAGCLILFVVLGLDDLVPPTDLLPLFLAFGQNYFGQTLMEINPVTWTLCVEAAFYVALPLVLLARSGTARVTLLVSLIGATVAWNALTYGGAWTDVSEKTLPAYAGHFALGMLVALWVESRRERRHRRLDRRAGRGGRLHRRRERLVVRDTGPPAGRTRARAQAARRRRIRAPGGGRRRGERLGRPCALRAPARVGRGRLVRRVPLAPAADHHRQRPRVVAGGDRAASRRGDRRRARRGVDQLGRRRAPGDAVLSRITRGLRARAADQRA